MSGKGMVKIKEGVRKKGHAKYLKSQNLKCNFARHYDLNYLLGCAEKFADLRYS